MKRPFVLPEGRPAVLHRPRTRDVELTRVDATHPHDWTWDASPHPRHRFDPVSGRFRVRYAGETPRTALRERYPERRIPAGHADHWLITLRGSLCVLDLTAETVLDALGVDDRISTARLPAIRSPDRPDPFLDACGQLADLVAGWWDDVHAIRYRSRTTPTWTNVAFCRRAPLETDAVPLASATDTLTRVVVGDGFDIPRPWLP